MIYGIRWHDGKDNVLTGSYSSVLSLAHVFEGVKIRYTVSLVGCLPMAKPAPDFQYWVSELIPKGSTWLQSFRNA